MSRLSVTSTNRGDWTGGGRRRVLVLGGYLDGESLPGLWAQVRAEAHRDVARVVLDISALLACDRDTLIELARRRGRLEDRRDCILDVVGARWSQFASVLAQEPVQNLDVIRAVIRELRRPIMLDLYTPRAREATEGLRAASVLEPRAPSAQSSAPVPVRGGSTGVAQPHAESLAGVAAPGGRGHDH